MGENEGGKTSFCGCGGRADLMEDWDDHWRKRSAWSFHGTSLLWVYIDINECMDKRSSPVYLRLYSVTHPF